MHKKVIFTELRNQVWSSINQLKINFDHEHCVVLIENTPAYFGDLYHVLPYEQCPRAFLSRRHQEIYLLQRAILRLLLEHFIGKKLRKDDFAISPFGKPYLRSRELNFNLAHSENFTIYAFSKNEEIGVDIEEEQRLISVNEISSLCCSTNELRELMDLDKDQKKSFFLALWTRKEAISKALGMGLNLDFRTLDVGFYEEEFNLDSSSFRLNDLSKPSLYRACLAEKLI